MNRIYLLVCVAIFTVAMIGVRAAAYGIVDNFGVAAGLVTIAAMYIAARWYDQRARR